MRRINKEKRFGEKRLSGQRKEGAAEARKRQNSVLFACLVSVCSASAFPLNGQICGQIFRRSRASAFRTNSRALQKKNPQIFVLPARKSEDFWSEWREFSRGLKTCRWHVFAAICRRPVRIPPLKCDTNEKEDAKLRPLLRWSEWRNSNPRPLGPERIWGPPAGPFTPFPPVSTWQNLLFAGLISIDPGSQFPLSSQICGQTRFRRLSRPRIASEETIVAAHIVRHDTTFPDCRPERSAAQSKDPFLPHL